LPQHTLGVQSLELQSLEVRGAIINMRFRVVQATRFASDMKSFAWYLGDCIGAESNKQRSEKAA